MLNPSLELRDIALVLRHVCQRSEEPAVREPLVAVESAANEVAKAWSGSNLGYHACVYLADLRRPPPGAHFSQDSGLGVGTSGDWREHQHGDLKEHILAVAGSPDLSAAQQLAADAFKAFADARANVDSILATWLGDSDDAIVAKLRERVETIRVLTASEIVGQQLQPRGTIITADFTALGQGVRPAPHQELIGGVLSCRSPVVACCELADIADQAASAHRTDRTARREVGGQRPR